MSAAMQVRNSLVAADGTVADDDALLIDMLDGETDIFDLVDRLGEQAIADKLLAEKASERAKRIERRSEHARDVISRILAALDLSKLERAVFTASLSYHTKPIITDPAALPEAFVRRAPDLRLIARALKDGPVSGAEQSNPEPRLTLRSI